MELALGNLIEENVPLTIGSADDIFQGCTLFPPVLWVEERGWREVRPGQAAPSGVVPSRWMDERAFLNYLYDDEIMSQYGKTWYLFLRKPTDLEYSKIQWRV